MHVRPEPTVKVLPKYARQHPTDRRFVYLVRTGRRSVTMYYPSDHQGLNAKIQAPFVLAEIRALRSSIFKSSPEVQRAIAIADKVERSYDLNRADLFIPALETFCAVLEPFAMTILTGTMRRVGYEIFPQYVSILGIPAANVKTAMQIK